MPRRVDVHGSVSVVPARRCPPTEAEVAYVGRIVAALIMDLESQASARASATPKPASRTLYMLSDAQLLAIYEGLGSAGEVRAERLRKKIGQAS